MRDDPDDPDGIGAVARSLVAAHRDGVTWRVLDELGWTELHRELPGSAVRSLATELGREAVPSCVAAYCVVDSLRRAGCDVGEGEVGLVLPLRGLFAADLRGPDPIMEGLVQGGGQPTVVVPVMDGSGPTFAVVRIDEQSCFRPVAGVDPHSDVGRVEMAFPSSARVLPSGVHGDAVAEGRRVLAYELLGLASSMLEIAVDHVASRRQFGRPLGSYQAVKHRLADVHVAREAAAEALQQSWQASDLPLAALVSKALAGRAALLAVNNCLQVTGGMGFTEEFSLAPRIRRSLLVEPLLGGGPELAAELGGVLGAGGSAPRLVDVEQTQGEG